MDIPSLYVSMTEAALQFFSVSHELGHLGVGLLIYAAVLGFAAAGRASFLPLAAVMLAEGLNEVIQANHYGSWRINDTLGDIVWTVAVPLLLFAHGRFGQWRATMPSRPAPEDRTAIFPV